MEVLIKLSDAIKTLKSMAVPLVRKLPSAQPERLTDYSFEESCTECPAYDTENHRCPRFNQVIRTALKDANLEPCENCISRQAAIDVLMSLTIYKSKREIVQAADKDENSWIGGVAECIDEIEDLPPAQPERMRGKWIERNPQNSDKCRLIECDQCGFSHIVGFNVPYEHWIENRNFCERCGADMRGKQDE